MGTDGDGWGGGAALRRGRGGFGAVGVSTSCRWADWRNLQRRTTDRVVSVRGPAQLEPSSSGAGEPAPQLGADGCSHLGSGRRALLTNQIVRQRCSVGDRRRDRSFNGISCRDQLSILLAAA